MKKIIFLLVLSLFVTGCASTGGNKSDNSSDIVSEPGLFADWQYRGFGQEYPLWAEAALNNDTPSLINFFPQLEGKENQLKIIIRSASDVDLLLQSSQPESESGVLDEIWVYIDPYYEEYEDRYYYIKIYLEE